MNQSLYDQNVVGNVAHVHTRLLKLSTEHLAPHLVVVQKFKGLFHHGSRLFPEWFPENLAATQTLNSTTV